MSRKLLRCLSVLGIFISVFPFVVLYEGVCRRGYTLWHYPVIYAVFAAFFVMGHVLAAWAKNPGHSRSFRPKALTLSKLAVVLPIIAFCIVVAVLELSGALFLYILPVCLLMYKGGYSSAGRGYADVFGRGWFAVFFVAAVLTGVFLWFGHDDAVISSGGYQLCIAFGVIIVISAVLTNQTNIDTCTQQRDAGRLALPNGIRSYNLRLSVGVTAAVVCLFLFAPPLARFLADTLKKLLALMLQLIHGTGNTPASDDLLSSVNDGDVISYSEGNEALMSLLYIVVGAVVIYVIIRFRRQIAAYFRELFSFLYIEKNEGSEAAYHDEYSSADTKDKSVRSLRRLEQQLYKAFQRETDRAAKYRLGYRLMLVRLDDTAFAVVPTDNTDIHRIKGENGLRSEKVQQVVSVYNKVRYSGYTPTDEEISFAEGFIEDIRRKI